MNSITITKVLAFLMISSSAFCSTEKIPYDFFYIQDELFFGDIVLNTARPHYQGGIKNVKETGQIACNAIREDNIKNDMIFVIQFHLKRFDFNGRKNAERASLLRSDLIKVINKYDYTPDCWERMDKHLQSAIYCFQTDDKR